MLVTSPPPPSGGDAASTALRSAAGSVARAVEEREEASPSALLQDKTEIIDLSSAPPQPGESVVLPSPPPFEPPSPPALLPPSDIDGTAILDLSALPVAGAAGLQSGGAPMDRTVVLDVSTGREKAAAVTEARERPPAPEEQLEKTIILDVRKPGGKGTHGAG